MADIFNEVEQDLRREQMKRLWDRIGIYVIAVAVLVVAITGGWRAYVAWQDSRAAESGDLFVAALKLSEDGDHAAAATALNDLAASSGAGYKLLARFRAATELSLAGDTAGSMAEFDAIAGDGALATVYRDLARIRAAYVALGTGDRAGVDARAAALAEGTGPWRQAAREVTGLAAYAAGDTTVAIQRFEQIVADTTGARDYVEQAEMMLALIRGSGAPAAAEPADAAPAAEEAPVEPFVAPEAFVQPAPVDPAGSPATPAAPAAPPTGAAAPATGEAAPPAGQPQ